MLNFLKQKHKNKIIFEYSLRVVVFLLLFIFISSLIAMSLFFPSFFFVKYKSDIVNNQLLSVKQKNINLGEDPSVFVKNVNDLSKVFSENITEDVKYRDVVDKIVSLKNTDIKILSITISKENDKGGKKVLLNGVAKTRDGLTLFNDDLKKDGFFDSVTFPVSNFIKSSNSEFSATLII